VLPSFRFPELANKNMAYRPVRTKLVSYRADSPWAGSRLPELAERFRQEASPRIGRLGSWRRPRQLRDQRGVFLIAPRFPLRAAAPARSAPDSRIAYQTSGSRRAAVHSPPMRESTWLAR